MTIRGIPCLGVLPAATLADPMPICASTAPSPRKPPQPLPCSDWPSLVAWLTDRSRVYPDGAKERLELPLFFPAEFNPEHRATCKPKCVGKSDEHAVRFHVGALDLDDITWEQFHAVVQRVGHLACCMLTTWSHTRPGKGLRFRLFVALSRPVEKAEWPLFWGRFAACVAPGIEDPSCKDITRGFYLGWPEGIEPWTWVSEGVPLDVDAVLALPAPAPAVARVEAGKRTPVSLDTIRDWLGTVLRRKHDLPNREAARVLGRILNREAYATPGDRDNQLWNLACRFAEQFPQGDPAELIEFAVPSFENTGTRDPSFLAEKILRAQQDRAAFLAAEAAEQGAGAADHVREAFDRTEASGRAHPYTPDELTRMPSRQWIIQVENRYWIRVLNDFQGPFSKDGISSAGIRLLSPAATAGVDPYTIVQGKHVPKGPRDLMLQYGTVAESLVFDLEQPSTYLPRTRTLRLKVAQRRPLQPRRWPIVDAWIDIAAGRQADVLRRWLGLACRTDTPLAMLLFVGPKGAGKNLLPVQLSRLWTTHGPTDMETAFDRYNLAMARCPIIFGDERIPTDLRGQPRTHELRKMISAGTHTVEEKFLPHAKLKGHVRLITGSNSLDVLRVNGNHNSDDLEAIADRILYVQADARAERWCKEQTGKPDEYAFFHGEAIAEHALYLETLLPKERPRERFGVLDAASREQVVAALTTRNDVQSMLLSWILCFLENPGKLYYRQEKGKIFLDKGNVYVNASLFSTCWEVYNSHLRAPEPGKVSRGLSTLAPAHGERVRTPHGRMRFRKLDLRRFFLWVEASGFSDVETVKELLVSAEALQAKVFSEYRLTPQPN